MANRDRRTVLSHLKNLMLHIIKWDSQEDKRSNSWRDTIKNSRDGITNSQKKNPSLSDEFLKQNWDKTFDKAKKEAEKEMKKESGINSLTWKEVFINKYTLIVIIAFILIKFFL